MRSKAVNIKVRVDRLGESYTEVEMILPDYVADYLLCETMDWKDRWLFEPAEYEEFLKTEKELMVLNEIKP